MSLEDPLFPVTITVGGTGQSYKIAAFPKEMHANQSFILQATLQKDTAGGGGAYDISGSTATLYVSGWKNNIDEVTLVTGVISDSGSGTDDRVTFTVPKDLIPESLGGLPLRKPGNSVFYFILEDSDSVLQFFQQVNVIDTNYTLSGDVDSSPNVIVPDKNDLGTVLEVNLNTPPGSPNFGDAYIIGTSPTGDWTGQNNDLTVYNGSSWVFYDTLEGNFVFDSNTSQQFIFNGTIWATTGAVTYSDGESINDNNSNALITFGVTASAVNEVKISNNATGSGPTIEAIGDDTNIDLNVNAKGTGVIKLDASEMQDTLDANDNLIDNILGVGLKSSTTLTISSGAITQTQLVHAIANESAGATDDLDSIVPATNQTDLYLTMSASGQVPTIKHATGTNTFLLADDTDLEMVMNTIYHFRHDGTNWKLAGSSASGGGGGGGNFPTSTDSSDKTTAYSVVSGDENTTVVAGSATSADFDITYDVSLWTTAGSLLTVANESGYIVRVVVSNTSTMTIGGGTDVYIGPNETITMAADTSTHVRVVART